MPLALWNYETKPGQGWVMDDTSVPMDGPVDLDQSLTVYMDQLGDESVWTNETI